VHPSFALRCHLTEGRSHVAWRRVRGSRVVRGQRSAPLGRARCRVVTGARTSSGRGRFRTHVPEGNADSCQKDHQLCTRRRWRKRSCTNRSVRLTGLRCRRELLRHWNGRQDRKKGRCEHTQGRGRYRRPEPRKLAGLEATSGAYLHRRGGRTRRGTLAVAFAVRRHHPVHRSTVEVPLSPDEGPHQDREKHYYRRNDTPEGWPSVTNGSIE
jgi:hypothetical protein